MLDSLCDATPTLNSAGSAPSPPAPVSCNLKVAPRRVGTKRGEAGSVDHRSTRTKRYSAQPPTAPLLCHSPVHPSTLDSLSRGKLPNPQWRPQRRRRRRWRSSSTRGRRWGSRRTTPPATSRPSTSPEGTYILPLPCALPQLLESFSLALRISLLAMLARSVVVTNCT